ncbi:MAG: NblA/ycf18 family protein [Cyanobacteria bacterium P01_C01_bin.70]
MDFLTKLSLGQQFPLKTFRKQVKEPPAKDSQGRLIEVIRQLMVKEDLIEHLVKQAA